MKKELFIRSKSSNQEIALLEDGKLVELHREEDEYSICVNDIFIGHVTKVASGLNAAFIELNQPKTGFLPYRDLGMEFPSYNHFVKQLTTKKKWKSGLHFPKLNKTLKKEGNISEVINNSDRVLVQVTKEPISSKGPRLSGEISIAGRYVVLLPVSNRISFSQKIRSRADKNKLTKFLLQIKPKNFGVIVRTSAMGQSHQNIEQDLNICIERWKLLVNKIKKNNGQPERLISEIDKTLAIIRDRYNDEFSSIWVDDIAHYEMISSYLKTIVPQKKQILKYHHKPSPIFEYFKIDKQINSVFGKTVNTKNGGYLTIESTEALHVIDVNSGRHYNKSNSESETAFGVNMMATEEIARQIRLRDLGGIIIIDFIDLKKISERNQLIEKLNQEMKNDSAKHRIYPPTKLGLVQISRQRIRVHKSLDYTSSEISQNRVMAPVLIIRDISQALKKVVDNPFNQSKSIYLHVDPIVAAYLKKGFPSLRIKWFFQFGKWITIIARERFQYLDFKFYDRNQIELTA
ncbi:MAG: Rne/Rng family ribonuclease [Flavobacteriaceae bacterium]|nr:Rne/Rng family ribonuclease [Flavobacteriaceae bacterium]MCY4216916.1 Rne/Rng family ribonuclease [Flavobacteriaceae bacterium]